MNKPKAPPPPGRSKAAQAELITFSQNVRIYPLKNSFLSNLFLTYLPPTLFQVHMLNQEAHKYLRNNKPGIRLSDLEPLPDNYKRPVGYLAGKNPSSEESTNYYQALHEQVSRYVYITQSITYKKYHFP